MNKYVATDLRQNLNRIICAVLIAAGGLTSTRAFAVEVPYAENFDSYPTGSMPNNFTIQTTGGGTFYQAVWSIQNATGNSGVYNDNASGDSVSTSSAINVTNLVQKNFTISTTFIVNSYTSFSHSFTSIQVGLNALASSSNATSTGYQLAYELLQQSYGFPAIGALELSRPGVIFSQSPTTLPVVTGLTYTMTFMGTYSSSGLLLTGTLNNGTDSISVTLNDALPATGNNFGYFDYASGLTNQGANVNVSYDNFSIVNSGNNLISAASVLTHGTAGTFAVDMPLTGISGVEARSAATYNAVFTFDTPVTSGEVTVTNGTASVGAITFNGNTMTAQLTGITPAEVVTLHLTNINGDGLAHGDVPFGFLVGDVDANRAVAKADQTLVESEANQPVTTANFRDDLDADGRIKKADTALIKANKGNTIP
jgi:hypothetical protein